MPDDYSSVDKPQHRNSKGLDDVGTQARRLYGKRALIASDRADGGLGRKPTRHGDGSGSNNPPAHLSALGNKSEPQPSCKRDEQPAASSTGESRMTSISTAPADLTFYPAYCHKASPTYFQWVKLTTHDIHYSLRHHEGYLHSWITQQMCSHYRDVPQLLFYKNHPIQFVQVIGIVVSLEEYFEKFWLFTIDDSSGATIDVICQKPNKDKMAAQKYKSDTSEHEKEEDTEIQNSSDQVAAEVDVGAILQVKGTITLFQRNNYLNKAAPFISHANRTKQQVAPKQEAPTRQITLQRLAVVHDTNKEVALIAARTKFYDGVLNKPWSLTKQEQGKLHRKALGEVEHKRKRVRRHAEKGKQVKDEEARDAEAILREYAEEERARESEAAEARAAGEALNESLLRERTTVKDMPKTATTATERSKPPTTGSADARTVKKEKRRKRRSEKPVIEARMSTTASSRGLDRTKEDTSLSFAADDGERSALLRAAFG